MNTEELMIGDLVRVNKDVSIKKGTIVEIRAIDADREFHELKGCTTCVPIDNPDGLSGGVWLDYLEPIPLTKEILERNGFVAGDSGREYLGYLKYYLFDDRNRCRLALKWYIKDNLCEMPLEEAPFWIIIKFVHQLQHVLLSCEIDKEIKLED